MAKFVYRLRHGNRFWFLGLYHSPKTIARTEAYFRHLERMNIILNGRD